MEVQGAVGARPVMPANCCAPPPPPTPDAPPPERAPVRGGGPARHAHHQHPHGGLLLGSVLGGGAATMQRPTPSLPKDPTILALVELLGDATAPERPASLARQLGDRLNLLLARAGERLAGMRGATTVPVPPAEGFDAPTAPALAPMPLQPPAPPGPTYTLDPTLGTIIELEPPHEQGDARGSADDGSAAPPSSWVPIPGWRLRPELADRLGSISDRIDALLDEAGITRLQLLALTILVPVGTAFLIAVVDRLVS